MNQEFKVFISELACVFGDCQWNSEGFAPRTFLIVLVEGPAPANVGAVLSPPSSSIHDSPMHICMASHV